MGLALALAGCSAPTAGGSGSTEAAPSCSDEDGDGHCAELDCNDEAEEIFPGASEVTCNAVDDDCDAATSDAPDLDGDGHSLCDEDCDDDPSAAPDLPELCDDEGDEDCDGEVDCHDPDCEGTEACEATCGNGVIEGAEECDDGASTTGDGCSADCRVERDPGPAGGVVEAPGDTGAGFADSALATNGVRGAGGESGGTDVFSLGYAEDIDNFLILGWPGAVVLNGPGTDFVIFENPFFTDTEGLHGFIDPAVVFLSQDRETWVPFPHDYLALDETQYSSALADWVGFAGIQPVLLHEEDNPVDPFEAQLAGGDAFDLDALPDDGGEAEAIKVYGFSYLKIVTGPTVINPDTGDFFVHDPTSNGADIDGVYGRYLVGE